MRRLFGDIVGFRGIYVYSFEGRCFWERIGNILV